MICFVCLSATTNLRCTMLAGPEFIRNRQPNPFQNLIRCNKIAIQTTAQMAADQETVGLSRVHMYESKRNLPSRDNCLFGS